MSREVLQRHLRGGDHPAMLDLLEANTAMLHGRLPDCYSHGRGGEVPRLREDLMGIPIERIACGAAHCAAMSLSGELYTWGSNECGQLGHGDKLRLSLRRRVLFGDQSTVVCGVACGREHTIAIADDGAALYAWGSDKQRQLGLGLSEFTAEDEGLPISISGDEVRVDGRLRDVHWGGRTHSDVPTATIQSVEAWPGGTVSLALPPDALVGAAEATGPDPATTSSFWSFENPPVAGIRDAMDCVLTPTVLRTRLGGTDERWAVLACGEAHSAAITTSGAAYSWGCADDGRLGVDLSDVQRRASVRIASPHKLELCLRADAGEEEPRAAMVDCGDDFTAFVDECGRLWACGANYDGQLGLPSDEHDEVWELTRVLRAADDVGVDFISCGGDHMAAADSLGRLWVWGGRFGETPSVVRLPRRPEAEPPDAAVDDDGSECALVACGSGLVVAVTDDGDAFTWGDGAGGRLGLGDGGADHEEPQRLAALSAPHVHVQMVACGKSVGSADEAPAVLVLATPEGPSQLSAQFERFLLAEAPRVH